MDCCPSLRTVLAVFLLFGVGCSAARAPAAPQTPEAPEPPAGQPTTLAEEQEYIESLEHALAEDESTLQALLHTKARSVVDQPAADSPESPPPTTTAPPKQPTVAGGAPANESLELEAREDPCDRACRALQSMRRAAEGICRLAGDDVARCQRAQSRVDAAEEFVESAGCSC